LKHSLHPYCNLSLWSSSILSMSSHVSQPTRHCQDTPLQHTLCFSHPPFLALGLLSYPSITHTSNTFVPPTHGGCTRRDFSRSRAPANPDHVLPPKLARRLRQQRQKSGQTETTSHETMSGHKHLFILLTCHIPVVSAFGPPFFPPSKHTVVFSHVRRAFLHHTVCGLVTLLVVIPV
jgi:hypothetical protein